MHPGNFIYFDTMQLNLGSCALGDIAVRVLVRVIGHYRESNMILIDCGWTGLSAQGGDHGYGKIIGHDLVIDCLKQEAGEVKSSNGGIIDFKLFPVGSFLQVAP